MAWLVCHVKRGGQKSPNEARSVYGMAMPGPDFVRSVMQHLGASSAAELAETMGWKRGTERLVAKWLNGDNQPNYERTWEMLDRCGWVNVGAMPTRLLPRPANEGLAEKIDAALENQERMWEQMEQLANAGVDLVASFELIREQVAGLRTLIEAPPTERRRAGRNG